VLPAPGGRRGGRLHPRPHRRGPRALRGGRARPDLRAGPGGGRAAHPQGAAARAGQPGRVARPPGDRLPAPLRPGEPGRGARRTARGGLLRPARGRGVLRRVGQGRVRGGRPARRPAARHRERRGPAPVPAKPQRPRRGAGRARHRGRGAHRRVRRPVRRDEERAALPRRRPRVPGAVPRRAAAAVRSRDDGGQPRAAARPRGARPGRGRGRAPARGARGPGGGLRRGRRGRAHLGLRRGRAAVPDRGPAVRRGAGGHRRRGLRRDRRGPRPDRRGRAGGARARLARGDLQAPAVPAGRVAQPTPLRPGPDDRRVRRADPAHPPQNGARPRQRPLPRE
jgi:hypothetical protein